MSKTKIDRPEQYEPVLVGKKTNEVEENLRIKFIERDRNENKNRRRRRITKCS